VSSVELVLKLGLKLRFDFYLKDVNLPIVNTIKRQI